MGMKTNHLPFRMQFVEGLFVNTPVLFSINSQAGIRQTLPCETGRHLIKHLLRLRKEKSKISEKLCCLSNMARGRVLFVGARSVL
jgi:hypothetical protein